MKLALAVVAALAGCTTSPAGVGDDLGQATDAATVCATSSTSLKGIDVSVYQGAIDWAKVASSGVVYAFIRVSDGLGSVDSKFATNWAGAKAHGVLRGVYQFFEPGDDAVAQADLMIAKMGTLEDGDLPPVIDVEATGGKTPAQVAAGVHAWIQHVEQVTGKTPIVYTGFYFWRDQVGGADESASPLWHAQYASVACPNIAAPWTTWAFWQYASTGSVPGISGNVDMDRFDGTRDQLLALGGPPPVCAKIPADGRAIDDGDAACFTGGGPTAYMRLATDAGDDGQLHWTHATDEATEKNFGEWALDLETAGRYHVEVYTAAAYAQSKQAKYEVLANGVAQTVTIDQSAVDGWQSLGDFDFAAGGGQHVHLGDNTGEAPADDVQLVFDTVRVTPAAMDHDPSTDPGDPVAKMSDGGCSTGGSSGGALCLLALGFVVARRRSR